MNAGRVPPAAGPVIHRESIDRETGLAEAADRPGHMPRRGHEQPAFPGFRLDQRRRERGVLVRVARAVLQDEARARHADDVGLPADDVGLGDPAADEAAPAGEDEARAGVASGEVGEVDRPLAGIVDDDLIARLGQAGLDAAAEDDDPRRGRAVGRIGGEALLQRQQQRISDSGASPPAARPRAAQERQPDAGPPQPRRRHQQQAGEDR